ncbi:hypothetical protein Tco_0792660 [Tanacetum coccineum]
MFHNLDQLRLHLERENLHGVNAKTCLQALRTQFKEFLASKGVNATDLLNQGWQQDFEDFTRCEPSAYRQNELNALKENGSQLHDEILHEHQIKSSVKMQSQDIQINPVQAMDDNLIVSKSSLIKPENNNAFNKSEIETQMQRQEQKADMREAVDAGLVVTESSRKKPDKQDIRSISHTEQSEPNYDTHLLETIDSNTTPTSTNMCHRGGKIDQDALVNAELLKTKDMGSGGLYFISWLDGLVALWPQTGEGSLGKDFWAGVGGWGGGVVRSWMAWLFVWGVGAEDGQEFKEFKSDEHASKDVWTKLFRPPVLGMSTHDAKTGLTDAEEKLLQEKFMLLMQELCLNLNPSPHKEDSLNSMAEQNVPAQPPTRTNEQIVPRSQWLIIGKSNLLFNAQKIQKNPIFQISVDILNNTNFFRAFTASASVPAIYMQQFWNTMKYDEKTGVYSCQVDEQWFDLSADLLRKALAITPVIPAHPFELPPSGNTVIDFVNELGTTQTPVSAMLWGIVTQTNVDHAELLWEEFTQGIQTFFSHKASHKASLKDPKKKVTPLLIPYGRFSKVIIYYLASKNNIHRRPDSAVHHTGDDFILGNLKFVPKGETVEVFGMAIPDPLITEAIQQSSYYPKYLEMVANSTRIVPQEEGDDPDLELAKKMILDGHQERERRRDQAPHDSTTGPSSQPEDDTSEKVVHESSSTTDSERTESGTEAAAPKGDKEQGEVASSTVTSGVGISVRTEDQAGSDPGKAHEALAGPDPEPMQEDQTGSDSGKVHVSLAGPNPEHMDEEFLATAYPKVHENLKLITDEHVIEDNPESHSGSMSSMKNLEDTDNFGDQFLNDKPTEDDQEKSKVVDESDSTIPDPSHQTVTSTPPITSFIALQLRVAKLEQDMSEVKKTDHSAAALASIKSQVPIVVDKVYQESKKSLKEIIRIKREQGEKKQESTYTIRTANKNPANYQLYHTLMEALIPDEDAMDKEVKDRVKDHKRKHDSDDDEDDDDDEGPSAGSNQDDEQSSKKPHDSDASASKQHPTLTSIGWQITDTRDAVIDSLMHRSEPESRHLNIPLMTFQNKMKGMSQIWRTLITLIFPR